MSNRPEAWRVNLASAAEADFRQVVEWTAERFGGRQADDYAETLLAALDALTEGPTVMGAKARDDLAKGLLVLHAARGGRKARHVILFRTESSRGKRVVEVLRILHDAMDPIRHFGPDEATGSAVL